MRNVIIYLFTGLAIAFTACEPFQEDNIDLGSLPNAPEISWSFVEGDSNRIVVTDLSTGNFNRLWEFPGGTPATSQLKSDTVLYTKAGMYEINLYVSAEGGSGTAFNSAKVEILNDAALECDPTLSLLTGIATHPENVGFFLMQQGQFQ